MANKVELFCKKCSGTTPHWDNRENKRNPKAPDYKCCACGSGIWPPKQKTWPGQANIYQTTPKPGPALVKDYGFPPTEEEAQAMSDYVAKVPKADPPKKFYTPRSPEERAEMFGTAVIKSKLEGNYYNRDIAPEELNIRIKSDFEEYYTHLYNRIKE
jgi:hypothetical protein